jgi:CheY-like chemotaxis protein
MKILVIDRDSLSTQLVRSKLETAGHTIIEEAVKNNAIERLQKEDFDAVFFDPAPLNNARPVVLGIRRSVRNYPYIILLSQSMEREEALKSGANDIMIKPLDQRELEVKVKNGERLTKLITRIGDESEDFPSAGGVIAKSAFNQLFLSCIDRADRYGERAFMVFIGVRNFDDLLETDGPYATEYATAKLSQYLVRLRRQSDIIAQTGKAEYCLLLQRPQYETEPMEAANRFADALAQFEDLFNTGSSAVEIYVRLMDLPVGQLHVEHIVTGQSLSESKSVSLSE